MNLIRDRWMFVPIVLLGVSVTIGITTVMLAVAGRPLGAEPDYYAKAVAWDARQLQVATNDRLHWNVSPELGPGVNGGARLSLKVNDKHGNLIDAQVVTVEAIPVRDADQREMLTMRCVAEGRFEGDLQRKLPGQWEFRVTVQHGNDTYTDMFRRTLTFGKPTGDGRS